MTEEERKCWEFIISQLEAILGELHELNEKIGGEE